MELLGSWKLHLRSVALSCTLTDNLALQRGKFLDLSDLVNLELFGVTS